MKYHSTREVTSDDLDRLVSQGWDIISTRNIKAVQKDGSFEEKTFYTVGEPLMPEDEFR